MSAQLRNDLTAALAESAGRIAPAMIAIRRDLHAHPELAFAETRTAGVVAAELARLGIAHRTGVGGTGVVGTITGGRPGPTLAIRADMDALPIREQTGLPYASRTEGLMHACGHDVHTSTLLGIAGMLQEIAPQLAGTVRLLFQPAEEILAGAAAMIADGAIEGVDLALGFHNYPNVPTGRFVYVRGACMAASDRFEITIHGVSGHAAHPERAVDPVVAAAYLVTQLQSVVSREVAAIRPAVVTIGAIHAGTVSNIIPDSCTLLGTVRSHDSATREAVPAAIRRLSAGIDAGMRVRSELRFIEGTPPLCNDEAVLSRSVAAIRAQLGEVVEEGEPSMGAEDFALIAERVPSFQLRIGSGPAQPGQTDQLHNSAYRPDEAAIGLGMQALARAAVELLAP